MKTYIVQYFNQRHEVIDEASLTAESLSHAKKLAAYHKRRWLNNSKLIKTVVKMVH